MVGTFTTRKLPYASFSRSTLSTTDWPPAPNAPFVASDWQDESISDSDYQTVMNSYRTLVGLFQSSKYFHLVYPPPLTCHYVWAFPCLDFTAHFKHWGSTFRCRILPPSFRTYLRTILGMCIKLPRTTLTTCRIDLGQKKKENTHQVQHFKDKSRIFWKRKRTDWVCLECSRGTFPCIGKVHFLWNLHFFQVMQ